MNNHVDASAGTADVAAPFANASQPSAPSSPERSNSAKQNTQHAIKTVYVAMHHSTLDHGDFGARDDGRRDNTSGVYASRDAAMAKLKDLIRDVPPGEGVSEDAELFVRDHELTMITNL